MRNLPSQVWILMFAYALMLSGSSLMGLTAGIIGLKIAPSPDQATLPAALLIIGVAATALPLGRLLIRYGRRRVYMGAALVAIATAFLAYWSLTQQTFLGFCIAAFLIGCTTMAAQQYRFSVIEAVPAYKVPVATSTILLGGILAAFIGPELAVLGKDLTATEFAGSFLLLAGIYTGALMMLAFVENSPISTKAPKEEDSSVSVILRSPVLILAVASAAIGSAVMSFVMTAAPITMHAHHGHSLEDTKLVIQSHIAAMYLPSILSGWLISRVGYRFMLWSGLLAFAICFGIALINTAFIHFWFAMVLLGIGWNFLFVVGTTLLPLGHNADNGFKVQSTNDFIVFSLQAATALSSGWFLYHWRWDGIIWASLPILMGYALLLLRTLAFASTQDRLWRPLNDNP